MPDQDRKKQESHVDIVTKVRHAGPRTGCSECAAATPRPTQPKESPK